MSVTLKCIVVDDEPLARDLIASYVDRTPYMTLVAKCSSAGEAHEIINSELPDIAFLDINMPKFGGIELARIIPDSMRVVVITAYDKYALEGFKVNALDYLMKPVSYNEFLEAANRALKWKSLVSRASVSESENEENSGSKYIVVKSEYKMKQIEVAEIQFIEGLKDYVKIYIRNEAKPVISQISLKRIEEALPDNFLRVHKSFLVNTSRITVIERGRIIFGDHSVPVGDSYRQAFSDFLSSRSI